MFAKLTCEIGLRHAIGPKRWGRGPRLQDLRHTFTTRRSVSGTERVWTSGASCPRSPPTWDTSQVGLTYWYIEAIPELLALATKRLVKPHRPGGER